MFSKRRSTMLYDSTGTIVNSFKIFGYCDGEQSWISLGNIYFPLLKTGNGFEFFITLTSDIKVLADLNMETGKPY